MYLLLYPPAHTNRALNTTARHSPVPGIVCDKQPTAPLVLPSPHLALFCTEQPVRRPAHDARPRTQLGNCEPHKPRLDGAPDHSYVYVPAIYIRSHPSPTPPS
jgi:hypothetical protein